MAVDFSLLPEEVPVPDDRPSALVWTVVFFVLTLGGVAVVLLLWPKNLPTQTLKFWVTLLVFPAGLAALVVVQRYSLFEGKVLDAVIYNEVCRE